MSRLKITFVFALLGPLIGVSIIYVYLIIGLIYVDGFMHIINLILGYGLFWGYLIVTLPALITGLIVSNISQCQSKRRIEIKSFGVGLICTFLMYFLYQIYDTNSWNLWYQMSEMLETSFMMGLLGGISGLLVVKMYYPTDIKFDR